MSTGKNSGGSTGKNITGGGGGIDRQALQDIKIVNGSIIVIKRSGEEVDLGAASDRAQEFVTHSIEVPIGNGEYELTHNLGTKSIIYQVFDSNDQVIQVPSIRYANKIKFFFDTTDSATAYTVVIGN
tara:strand:- start:591 stop:971 length:381 start_codon:yes stop_codon:yes gene_type:complete